MTIHAVRQAVSYQDLLESLVKRTEFGIGFISHI
jgi:hypothetical protein